MISLAPVALLRSEYDQLMFGKSSTVRLTLAALIEAVCVHGHISCFDPTVGSVAEFAVPHGVVHRNMGSTNKVEVPW